MTAAKTIDSNTRCNADYTFLLWPDFTARLRFQLTQLLEQTGNPKYKYIYILLLASGTCFGPGNRS